MIIVHTTVTSNITKCKPSVFSSCLAAAVGIILLFVSKSLVPNIAIDYKAGVDLGF